MRERKGKEKKGDKTGGREKSNKAPKKEQSQ
jgi:hypothetical protein